MPDPLEAQPQVHGVGRRGEDAGARRVRRICPASAVASFLTRARCAFPDSRALRRFWENEEAVSWNPNHEEEDEESDDESIDSQMEPEPEPEDQEV